MKTNYNIITRYRNKKNQPDSLRILQMIKLFAKLFPMYTTFSNFLLQFDCRKRSNQNSFYLNLFMDKIMPFAFNLFY